MSMVETKTNSWKCKITCDESVCGCCHLQCMEDWHYKNNYFEMAYGKKDGFGYLDGVPIRIHEKCIAPKKVTLPPTFHYCLSPSLVNAQYDFTLENEVLKWTEKYEEQLAALENAKIDKVASDIEEFTKLTGASDTQSSTSKLTTEESPVASIPNDERTNGDMKGANSSYVPGWQHDSILQPQQVSCQSVSNGPENARRKNINISDFENDSSSPFDYMELQTINDLEELNSVFQDMTVMKPSYSQSDSKIEQNTVDDLPSLSQSKEECRSAVQFGCRTTIKRTRSHPTVDSLNLHYRNGCENPSNSNNVVLANNMSLSNSMTSRFSSNYSNSRTYDVTAIPATSYVPTENEQNTFHCVGDGRNSYFVTPAPCGIRSCKSISDLSRLEDNSIHSPENENLQRPNTPSHRPQKPSEKNTTEPALPDPYEELTPEQQQLVLIIEEMGFPRGQVARAVKHLGEDSKKVVEHLCQVQKLVEAGHSDIDAEIALHINEYKIEEATKFLEFAEQLRGLGFEKNAVTRALVQHKNDRDKVLDALLSSS